MSRDPEPPAGGSTALATGDAVDVTSTSVRPRARDRFVDVVRSLALARVILWHTWSAAWLSWFPAMPAMFFSTGALLEPSLERRGWWGTVRQRARRLMIPFWLYSAVAVTVMVVAGWRPAPAELVGWVVPLVDPVGSDELRGLWLPLWYVRAYVWFVLAAGAMRWLVRRLGIGAPLLFATATVAVFWAEQSADRQLVPLSLLDAASYGTFVAAGMLYSLRDRALPSRKVCVLGGLAAAAAAAVTVARLGPDDFVVNRSALLVLLVGAAGLMLLLGLHPFLSSVGGIASRAVDVLVGHTLTIYLWHGFGLVAAAEIVDAHFDPGPLRWTLSLAVVVAVTAGCTVLFGPVEDWAAGRRSRPVPRLRVPRFRPVPFGRVVFRGGAAVLAIGLVAVALVRAPDGVSRAEPLSGRAVAARAAMLDATTTTTTTLPGAPAVRPTLAQQIDAWVQRHPRLQGEVGLTSMRGALIDADGAVSTFSWRAGSAPVVLPAGDPAASDDPMVWWSMTKAATAVWLMRSVEAGVVSLQDPLSRWVPEFPDADRITLEQLGRHQSGISNRVDDPTTESEPIGVLQRFLDDPRFEFEPGSGFHYSRLGYLMLGLALERATGTTWRAAMEDLATQAGTTVGFDEDTDPLDHVTDPDQHGYRGRTWSAGGIVSGAAAQASFVRWALTQGIGAMSLEVMAAFAGGEGDWIYGIGLSPLCPCARDDTGVHTRRVGLDSASGSFAVDLDTGATVVLYPNIWWDADGVPQVELYELESVLLDALA